MKDVLELKVLSDLLLSDVVNQFGLSVLDAQTEIQKLINEKLTKVIKARIDHLDPLSLIKLKEGLCQTKAQTKELKKK